MGHTYNRIAVSSQVLSAIRRATLRKFGGSVYNAFLNEPDTRDGVGYAL